MLGGGLTVQNVRIFSCPYLLVFMVLGGSCSMPDGGFVLWGAARVGASAEAARSRPLTQRFRGVLDSLDSRTESAESRVPRSRRYLEACGGVWTPPVSWTRVLVPGFTRFTL